MCVCDCPCCRASSAAGEGGSSADVNTDTAAAVDGPAGKRRKQQDGSAEPIQQGQSSQEQGFSGAVADGNAVATHKDAAATNGTAVAQQDGAVSALQARTHLALLHGAWCMAVPLLSP